MSRSLLAFGGLLLALQSALLVSANCYTFYGGLCPGDYSCQCTLHESCGSMANRTKAANIHGGCSGACRTVIHDQCTGPDSCMKDGGSCVIPTPQPSTAKTMWGVDYASPFHNSTFDCLVNNNISFGIVRAHQSDGGVDPNAPPMIKKMRAAGFKKVMAYLFPCTTFNVGHTAKDQVKHTVDYLAQHGATPDQIFFDIEWNHYDPACDWSHTNKTSNCVFIEELVAAAASTTSNPSSIPFGFYAGKTFWDSHLPGCTAAKHLPLWYAAYDNVQSFQDWQPYGGWTAPMIKQYNDKTDVCNVGAGMDANWAPNGV